MPGARRTRSRAWCVVNTRVSHHGHAGNTRHSPRRWFYGFLRSLPGDRLFVSVPAVMRQHHRPVGTSVGVSERYDFAVRGPRRSSFGVARVHRIPLPTFVTIAKRPSWWRGMGGNLLVIWGRDQWLKPRPNGTTGKSVFPPAQSGKRSQDVKWVEFFHETHRSRQEWPPTCVHGRIYV